MKLAISRRRDPRTPAPLGDAAAWRLLDMVYADPAALWLNLALSIVIGAMTFICMRDLWSAGWGCFGFCLALARILDRRSYAVRRAADRLLYAQQRFLMMSSLVGIYWGCASLVLLLSDDAFLQFWVVNAETAALAVAVARNNPMAKAVKVQVFLTTLPLVVSCLLANNLYFQSYSVMTVLYMLTLIAVVRHLNDQTVRLLLADEQNLALLGSVSEANARLEVANRQLEAMATTDGLTGIANRRRFDDTIRREWHRTRRGGTSLSVLLIDIDRFKRYNDAFGHQSGDLCLRRVAGCIAGGIQRSTDLAARYGGEEFAVIIVDADAFGIIDVAERLRAAVEAMALPGPSGTPVTISIGVATCWPSGAPDIADEDAATRGIEALVAEADAKLYDAKRAGRNCVRSVTVPVKACHAAL